MLMDGGEPECYGEVIAHVDARQWLKAMKEEMEALRVTRCMTLFLCLREPEP